MPARTTTLDLDRPPLEAREVIAIGAALGDPAARVEQGAEPEKAGSALRRALLGEVTHDARGVTDAAPARGHDSDHPATEIETARSQGCSVEPKLPRFWRRDPGPEVAAEKHCARRLRDAAGHRHRFFYRGAGLDLEDTWALDPAGDRDQDCACRPFAAGGFVPGVSVTGDQGDVRQCLDVLNERGRGGHTAFAWVGRSRGRGGDAIIDEMDGGAGFAGHVSVWGGGHARDLALRLWPLRKGCGHRGPRGFVLLADIYDDLGRVQGSGGEK